MFDNLSWISNCPKWTLRNKFLLKICNKFPKFNKDQNKLSKTHFSIILPLLSRSLQTVQFVRYGWYNHKLYFQTQQIGFSYFPKKDYSLHLNLIVNKHDFKDYDLDFNIKDNFFKVSQHYIIILISEIK